MMKAKDDPKTPAKPSERRTGSDRNPSGSASGQRGGITLSEANIKTLENKRDEHNEKYKDTPSKRVTMGQLKAVFRRGAGAFSTSHRPSVTSRDQWAIARVNAFLHLMGTGKPKNSKYVTDNDLLPASHPRSTKKEKAEKAKSLKLKPPENYHWMDYQGGPVLMPGEYAPHEGAVEFFEFEIVEEHDESRLKKYGTPDEEFARFDPLKKGEEWDAIYNAILERTGDKELAAATATARAGSRFDKKNYKPPQSVVREVNQGFSWQTEYKRSDASTRIGALIRRGKSLPIQTVKDMVTFFAGHEKDLTVSPANRDPSAPGYPGAGLIAWKLYGGDAGRKWAQGVIEEWREETEKQRSYSPPKGVQREAALGLKWRREHGRGGTEVGVARARNLSNGDNIPLETINRMVSFFARHEVDLDAPKNKDPGADGYPGAGLIAWKLWGGDAGRRWANTIAEREKKKVGKASKEYMEAALKLAKEELPGWAYARIHQAAMGSAGGRRRNAKAGEKLVAKLAMAQMSEPVVKQMSNEDIKQLFDYLSEWFQNHKRDVDVKPLIVGAAALVMSEMTQRGMKCPPGDLNREVAQRREVEKAQLRKLNESTIEVHSPHSPIVFVVEEPNSIDKARGEYLVGQDGRIFKDLYLKKLGLKKSDVCIVDITQLDWVETKRPREIIALGRVAKNALGDLATCVLPHPKAVRRFGDSGEINRKLNALLKRSNDFLLDHSLQNSPILETRAEEDKNTTDELIEKQDCVGQDLPGKSESLVVPISKADSEKQIVYGIVLDPYQIDSQDDWVPPRAIEETAHRWLAESRVIGLDHSDKANAFPVESYMVPYPPGEYDKAMANEPHKAYTMPFGDDVVHSGSWVLGTKLGDSEWSKVKEGELNAYSIGGYGNRTSTTKQAMPAVEFLELKEER